MKQKTEVVPSGEKHLSNARSFQGIPGIASTSGGRLWAVWYSGGRTESRDNYSLLAKSDDNGNTWSDAIFVTDPENRDTRSYDPTLWTDPEGKLHFFWTESTSRVEGRISDGFSGVWESVLQNPDEADLRLMRWTPSRKLAPGIMLNKPSVLKNGTWILPISVWAPGVGKAPFRKSMQGFVGAGLYATAGNGKVCLFRGRARITEGSIFDEHIFIECSDGTIKAYIRTVYGFAESVSTDGGWNWSSPVRSRIPGPNSRMCVRRLRSGRLLFLVNAVRPEDESKGLWRPRRDITAYLSEDDGATFCGELLLDGRENVSYPDFDQAPDGTIYAVYDRVRTPNGEILLARFTEEDVLAGKIVSSGSSLGILISRSSGVLPEA